MTTKHIILLIALSLACRNSSLQQIDFDNYSNKDGLPQNIINDILQDSEGYLWFATQIGVSKFDGTHFTNFNVDDGLISNYVWCMTEDNKGQIWFGTEGGISVYADNRFVKNYTVADGLLRGEIEELFIDSRGRVWSRSVNGVSKITSGGVESYTTDNGLPDNQVLCFFEDEKKQIWCGTANGIAVFAEDTILLYTLKNGLTNNIIRDITGDLRGNVWIATQGGGILKYDGNYFKRFNEYNGLSSNINLTLSCDKEGNIWSGNYQTGLSIIKRIDGKEVVENITLDESIREILITKDNIAWLTATNGIIKLDDNGLHHYDTENGLVSNSVFCLQEDFNGNIWIGTLEGVSKYGKGIFEIYNKDQGLVDNNILSVLSDRNGNIWCGTYEGITRINNLDIFTYEMPENLCYAIFQDSKDRLWFGTYYGLYIFRSNSFEVAKGEKWSEIVVNDISEDKDGALWLATNKGILKYDESIEMIFNQSLGIIDEEVKTILVEPDKIWAGTEEGLSILMLNDLSFKNYSVNEGLPRKKCTDLCKDREGNIWLTTHGGLCSLKFYDSLKIDVIAKENGLTSNILYFVQVDEDDNLWIGHEKGLDRYNPENKTIVHYGPEDGFYPMETYEGATTIDRDGNLWFGTIDGLVKYIPENDKKSISQPRTYITNIRLFDEDILQTKFVDSIDSKNHLPIDLKLPHNQNFLTFEYIGLHFTNPEKNRYQYILKEYDQDWSAITTETFAQYKNLPFGDYTFMVRAANDDGVWIKEPVTYSFEINPPFWQTGWFYGLEIITGIFIIYLIIMFRERKLRHDKKVLAQKVKERTREIEAQKEAIEAINAELQEQQKQILMQRDEIKAQRDLAQQQRDMISAQNEEIRSSILYAKRIQNAVLPEERILNQILQDYFILFKPRDIVSGDFYWMARKNGKSIVVAADCTGHGVPGAFMSMLGVSLLNEIVNKYDDLKANQILDYLREDVKKTLSQTGKLDETKDGMDLALCIHDTENNRIEYAGAYNSLYMIRDCELIEYKADKMPIGIHAGVEVPFTNHEIEIQKGDAFYLFSDGYADQFGGEKGKKFRSKPFKRLLVGIHYKSMPEQKKILDKTIENWKGDFDQIDDMLVIGFRV